MKGERFTVSSVVEGEAFNGLPGFYHEVAILKVPDLGEARIGMALNMARIYVMLPGEPGRPANDAPPRLFALDLSNLFQAVTQAAVERYQSGEPVKGGAE